MIVALKSLPHLPYMYIFYDFIVAVVPKIHSTAHTNVSGYSYCRCCCYYCYYFCVSFIFIRYIHNFISSHKIMKTNKNQKFYSGHKKSVKYFKSFKKKHSKFIVHLAIDEHKPNFYIMQNKFFYN